MSAQLAQPRQVVGRRRQRQHVQERGNTRRKQLLETAAALLQSTPIEELSFKQVSEAAGVPEGSAYHFFANRYDLLGALAKEIAAHFGAGFQAAVAGRGFTSWHELADTLIDQAVRMYRENPAAMQIWLSGRAPAQVRLADHVSGIAISHVIHDIFDDYFELPKLPEHFDPFFFFLEMCDVPLSVSVIEHNTITNARGDEAKRAGKSYLGTYLPPVLQKRIA